jgi:hypothetical protein
MNFCPSDCTSVSDKYFFEELMLHAGPEIGLQWLSRNGTQRVQDALITGAGTRTQSKRETQKDQPGGAGLNRRLTSWPSSKYNNAVFSQTTEHSSKYRNESGNEERSHGEIVVERHSTQNRAVELGCLQKISSSNSLDDRGSQSPTRSQLPTSSSCPELVRDLQRRSLQRSHSTDRLGLLFTDAAHTVIDRLQTN